MGDDNVIWLISHHRIIDGFGELSHSRVYVPFETFCGICDEPFTLYPKYQKFMLEIRGVPVKMLQRGAVYCVSCKMRHSRIKWLHRHDRWRTEPDGAAELQRLKAEQSALSARSRRRYEEAIWPYPFPW